MPSGQTDLVINIDKPEGLTSHEATTKVKRLLRAKKAGHTGTLDPMATGVLLVCINRATRLARYLSSLDKEYEAVMKLGEVTDTQDSAGEVIKKTDPSYIEKTEIERVITSFRGRILQRPPMFSALKYRGRPLYKYARRGEEVQRDCREVTIHRIELLDIDLPLVRFRVLCSKGTYIRTLCHDIGERLGVGAHLYRLKRTAIGPFTIKESVGIDEIGDLPEGRGIYRMDEALSWMPALTVGDELVRAVRHGTPLRIEQVPSLTEEMKLSDGIRIRSSDGVLLAIGSFFRPKRMIRMDVVFGS
jgi:tRNA pseudouridine55 synthase